MTAPEPLLNLLESWASLYANHPALRTSINFFHLGGLLLSGGLAIAADRMILLARHRQPAERAAQLAALRGIHRLVLIGLAFVAVSGLFLFGADAETFLYSKMFWTKMALFGLLLANGGLLVRAERQAEHGDARGWTRLIAASIASIALWFLTTLAGSALPNA